MSIVLYRIRGVFEMALYIGQMYFPSKKGKSSKPKLKKDKKVYNAIDALMKWSGKWYDECLEYFSSRWSPKKMAAENTGFIGRFIAKTAANHAKWDFVVASSKLQEAGIDESDSEDKKIIELARKTENALNDMADAIKGYKGPKK